MMTDSGTSAGPIEKLSLFANPAKVIHGWYWALPSRELHPRCVRVIDFIGRQIALFRTADGHVRALDAFCPHMGSSFEGGRVEGESLQCPFHGRAFNGDGICISAPKCHSASRENLKMNVGAHRVREKYGIIWLHTDAKSTDPLPSFEEFEGKYVDVSVDQPEHRRCHPTLILGGGVDEEHFNFVHARTTALSGPLSFRWQRLNAGVIRFWNEARIPLTTWKAQLMSWLYEGTLHYDVTYWSATTALARLGPKRVPLYSIFAYRPTSTGETVGLNIYLTPRRGGLKGFFGLFSQLRLLATRIILKNGGREDAVIQNRIRFIAGPGAFSNPPFAAFVRYVEEQRGFSSTDHQEIP